MKRATLDSVIKAWCARSGITNKTQIAELVRAVAQCMDETPAGFKTSEDIKRNAEEMRKAFENANADPMLVIAEVCDQLPVGYSVAKIVHWLTVLAYSRGHRDGVEGQRNLGIDLKVGLGLSGAAGG